MFRPYKSCGTLKLGCSYDYEVNKQTIWITICYNAQLKSVTVT